MIQFRDLTHDDAETIRQWRNADLSHLRTPHFLTAPQQVAWYRDVVCNRDARVRWWGVWADCGDGDPPPCYHFRGVAGLEHIEWENRRAEVSLIIAPHARGSGVGRDAVGELLRQAWEGLNLDSVYGEVYECGPVQFWRKVLPPETKWATIPQTKWFGGRYWDSQVFTVLRPVGNPRG